MNFPRIHVPEFFRQHAGAILGAILGFASGLGLFGLALGAIVGFLVDELIIKAVRWKKLDRFFTGCDRNGITAGTVRVASIVAIASSIAVSRSSSRGRRNDLESALLGSQIGELFELEGNDRDLVSRCIGRISYLRAVDLRGMCSQFAAVTAENERETLVTLLYRIVKGDGEEVRSETDELIGKISEDIGLSPNRFNAVRARDISAHLDSYAILGVAPGSEMGEIKRVYRKLASQFHPDLSLNLDEKQKQQAQEAFVRIQNAYKRIIAEHSGQRKTDDGQMD